MTKKPHRMDNILLILVGILVAGGFLIFSSASLGLMARDGATFASVASSQFIFGVVGGGLALLIMSNIHYRRWRKHALYIFVLTLALTALVFVPGLGLTHSGATRWLDLGFTTLQPSEFLKIGYVIYLATWFSGVHKQIDNWRYGIGPFLAVTAITAVVMLLQPDTDTFLIMTAAGMAMFIVAGAKWRDVGLIMLSGIIMLAVLAMARPYVMDRILTFTNPDQDPLGSGYQIQQSLIAVGSGGFAGRGFGQSIQKFEYLPEPIGDSIFAVYAEEFGFIGTVSLIVALLVFAFRGYKIATKADDIFGTLLIVGFMTIIIAQAFLNIGAMIAIAPLSGLPLPFISHGGTALLATLAAMGIVLNVSKYQSLRR